MLIADGEHGRSAELAGQHGGVGRRQVAHEAAADEGGAAGVPLLAGRTTSTGASAAFVCRGFVCELPTSDPEALALRLR